MNNNTQRLYLRASFAQDHGNGIISLDIPCRHLEPSECDLLEKLFPYTQPLIEEAMATETLLSSLAKELDAYKSNSNIKVPSPKKPF